MARVLIVGCGCRGSALGELLLGEGLEVRGTSRSPGELGRIADRGIEPAIADPNRVGSVLEHVGDVAVVVWALGSATGESALEVNGPRLERVLEHLVDTPVRGFVYEGAGSVISAQLEAGATAVEAAQARWRLPARIITAPAARPREWIEAMASAVMDLLRPHPGP